MAGNVLHLRGCTPEPLGDYLKGLGVFRLIAEQADAQARAWWKDGFLHVRQSKWPASESTSAESQCVDWLLKDCRFTPLIAPWQTGTGYLPKGKRDAGALALVELLNASHPGVTDFRRAFRDVASSLGIDLGAEAWEWEEMFRFCGRPPVLPYARDAAKWLEAMKEVAVEHSDADLLRGVRNRIRLNPSLKWLDAVGMSAARSRDSDMAWWFPILASGGGEASGQYIVNHQQRLKSVLLEDQEHSRARLAASLTAHNQPETLEGNSMGAMYYPSLMKVPNAGQDFLPNPQRRVNPWDFILLLEGCLVWSMTATRRKGVTSERASFPFYCRSSFGGSTMIGPKEVEGSENSIANGELWCPVWSTPTTLTEVDRIFGEGRIQVGERLCTRSLNFALAMTGLGIDRGIQAFHRYSLLERSGSGRQTTLLAVPNGCVVPHRETGLSLLSELRDFAESVSTNLTDNGQQSRRLMLARIDFERAWFDATSSTSTPNGHSHESLSSLLVAAGRLTRELGTNTAKPGVVKIKRGEQTSERQISPIGALHGNWAKFIEKSDLSSEFRLARSIVGITAWGESKVDGRQQPAVECLLANLVPVVRPWGVWEWYDAKRHKGVHDISIWSRGASVDVNLAAILRRRLIDAQRGSGDGLPLWSSYGVGFGGLLAFWHNEINDDRLSDLIHGLALVNFWNWEPGPKRQERIDNWQKSRSERSETPDIDTSEMCFDDNDTPRGRFRLPPWLDPNEFDAACELPRVYHLLKLCFVGGRLPHRPVERATVPRGGAEPFPPSCLDVLALLEAGRLADAVRLAARRLRAKGYPALLRDGDLQGVNMTIDECRRIAGMLLIPVRQPGVCAALAIKPEVSH